MADSPYAGILQALAQNWKYLLIPVGFGLLFTLFSVIRKRQVKAGNDAFLAEHPDAAQVLCGAGGVVAAQAVQILSVDGQGPQMFNKGNRMGAYLLPGDRTLQARYTYQRPGVMYKTVTKTYDGTVVVSVEANKSYTLDYDRKAEQFIFTETAQ